MLIEETAVSPAALPLAEFKAHLRLGTGFADDDIQDPVLESFLRAAIAAIEGRTGKMLLERIFLGAASVAGCGRSGLAGRPRERCVEPWFAQPGG